MNEGLLNKIGLIKVLIPGYIALTIFTIGEGIDKGWISSFFISKGFNPTEIGVIIGFYGLITGIAGWLSGILTDMWKGPRKVMLFGVISWLIFQILFLTLGYNGNIHLLILTYGLRAMGYPLFVFAFITWIAYEAPEDKMGSSMGWFWFWHTLGYVALSGYIAGWLKNTLTDYQIFLFCVPWIIVGGIIAIITASKEIKVEKSPTFREALGVIKYDYRTAIIAIVRLINTAGLLYALPIFMPLWITTVIGFSMSEWLFVWSTMFLSNTICNLFWGFIGDRIGWRNTVLWFGGVGSAICMLLYYLIPIVFGHNFYPFLIIGILSGALLAAYTPLSAIAGTIIPTKKGSVMGLLNLGGSMSYFVGGILGGLIYNYLGATGVAIVFSLFYLIGAGLTYFLPNGPIIKKLSIH